MPGVSIYMSSYNHARYLRESIQSVLGQTFRDFELFILDDASTDDSWNIIQSFTDPRIHPMRNEVNRNDKSVMRRVISEFSRGEYFAVHHSDNIWEPGKLQAQVDFLDDHPGFGAVFTNALSITENGEPLTDETHFYYRIFDQPNRSRFEWLRFFFYEGNALCHPSVLIRKDCYEKCGSYRDGLGQIPDMDMWIRLCLSYPIHVLPEKFVRFRVPLNKEAVSAERPDTRVRCRFELLKVLENYLQITDWETFKKVFPEAKKYERGKDTDTAYALARLALDAPGSEVYCLFGLNILYDILGDPVRSRRVYDQYGFTHKDFITLNAANDVFSIEQRGLLERENKRLSHLVDALTKELREIHLSKGWRFINRLRRLRSNFLPAGSRLEKTARVIAKWAALPFAVTRERRIARQLEKIHNSGLFDAEWYLARYPDVALAGIDPARHYLLHGGMEGRDPGPVFSSRSYFADHPEVVAKRVNPLLHHLKQVDK